MIVYFDTSALVKKYFKEDFTIETMALWKKTSAIVTSSVTFAEVFSALNRKKWEDRIDKNIIQETINIFKNDWESFIRVDVNKELNQTIEKLAVTHPLRGFDTIHLASALIVDKYLQKDIIFACFDKNLLKAAEKENLKTFPANFNGPIIA